MLQQLHLPLIARIDIRSSVSIINDIYIFNKATKATVNPMYDLDSEESLVREDTYPRPLTSKGCLASSISHHLYHPAQFCYWVAASDSRDNCRLRS